MPRIAAIAAALAVALASAAAGARAQAGGCGFSAFGTTYDLSPLTQKIFSYVVADPTTDETYRFNVCQDVTVQSGGDPQCQAGGGMVCQYSGSTFASVDARWNASNPSSVFWDLIDPTQPAQGVQMVFNNGDLCPSSGQPITTAVIFPCNPNVAIGPLQVDADECQVNIYLPTKYACPANLPPTPPSNCTFSVGNLNYDFSSLTLTDGFYASGDAVYNYTFNICGPLPMGSQDPACPFGASFCQFDAATGKFVAVVARWTGLETGTFSNSVIGPRLNSNDGDICFNSQQPRTAQVQFLCSKQIVGVISVHESSTDPCQYYVNFPTSLACK